jgi:hypothetical protein
LLSLALFIAAISSASAADGGQIGYNRQADAGMYLAFAKHAGRGSGRKRRRRKRLALHRRRFFLGHILILRNFLGSRLRLNIRLLRRNIRLLSFWIGSHG